MQSDISSHEQFVVTFWMACGLLSGFGACASENPAGILSFMTALFAFLALSAVYTLDGCGQR